MNSRFHIIVIVSTFFWDSDIFISSIRYLRYRNKSSRSLQAVTNCHIIRNRHSVLINKSISPLGTLCKTFVMARLFLEGEEIWDLLRKNYWGLWSVTRQLNKWVYFTEQYDLLCFHGPAEFYFIHSVNNMNQFMRNDISIKMILLQINVVMFISYWFPIKYY